METRTFRPLERADLKEILRHTLVELDRFLSSAGSPPGKFSIYANRLVAICLCQGAAQHVVDVGLRLMRYNKTVTVSREEISGKGLRVLSNGKVVSGVKDIDVCLFFEEEERVRIPDRNHCIKRQYITFDNLGRRPVDFLKKGIRRRVVALATSPSPKQIVMSYIAHTVHGHTQLADKSVVGLYPRELFGRVLWATRRLAAAAADERRDEST